MNPTTVGKDGVDRPWVRLPRPKRDPLVRFREKYVVDPTGCHLWQDVLNGNGYGRFSVGYERMYAHAFACDVVGKYCPEGMEHDHLCRVRHCVNAEHIEIVTPRVNNLRGFSCAAVHARKVTCPQGHPYDNIRRGARECTICRNAKANERYARLHPPVEREPQHGTAWEYAKYRCRCESCRAANTAVHRAYLNRAASKAVA